MKLLRHPALHWVLGIVLGVVFLYASHDKILAPKKFAQIVYHYQILGPSQSLGFSYANVWAVVLPWIEVVVGLALITGLWRREAALIAGALLAVFIGSVGWAMGQGIDIANCGCFTVSEDGGRAAGWGLIAGDTVLLAMAAVLAFVQPVKSAAAAPDHGPSPAPFAA